MSLGRRMLRWFGGAVLALAVLGGLGAWQAWEFYRAAGPLAAPAQLVVPRGGTEAIAAALTSAGIIDQPRLFLAAAWLTRDQGRCGRLVAFPAGASMAEVLGILRQARPVQRRLTIPEGLTARQILALLDRAEGLTGTATAPAEGMVLPETYAYQWGDDRAALLRRAELAMQAALSEAWNTRGEGCRWPPRGRR
ncbi:endolytic transglycosylase MltG [Siccirubricoccus deserti]